MHIPVKGHQDLVRDNFSKAILNVDDEARKIRKMKAEARNKEKQEIENIKRDIVELKDMMSKILDKLS